MKSKLPKVLVISPNSLGASANGSILMSNLFSGWPKDKIISIYSNSAFPPDYKLVHSAFFTRGEISSDLRRQSANILLAASGNAETLDGFISFIPSKRLKAWLKHHHPEVIYSQMGSAFMSQLTLFCAEYCDIPLITHIMDDYVSVWPSRGRLDEKLPLIHKVLNKYNAKLLNNALHVSAKRFVISEHMKSEYSDRYHLEFETLHNGISLHSSVSDTHYPNNENRVLYMGSILDNVNLESINKFLQIIEDPGLRSYDVTLDILSNQTDRPILNLGSRGRILEPVEHSRVIPTMKTYKALLFPYNFDNKSVEFIKYSMPTRICEYAMSGVPIIAMGSPEVGFLQDISRHKAAFCLFKNESDFLVRKVAEFFDNTDMHIDLSRDAIEYACQEFDINKIRDRFQSQLIEVAR